MIACKIKPEPGTRVRFSRYFLIATGQDVDQHWLTIDCDCDVCSHGRHVAVNEPSIDDGLTETRPRWRHISYSNLERVVLPAEDEPPTIRVQVPK
jgi:hypothetical protein